MARIPVASELRTTLILQRKSDTRDLKDDFDQTPPEWVNAGVVSMARIEHKGGGDRLDVSQMVSVQQYDITIRYHAGIMVGDRWWDRDVNRFFNIDTLNDIDMKHKWLLMRCILQQDPAPKS